VHRRRDHHEVGAFQFPDQGCGREAGFRTAQIYDRFRGAIAGGFMLLKPGDRSMIALGAWR
jgi:hypothetical protein